MLGLESVQCVVLVHAIRVEQVKEILGHLFRGGRKISALFAESTEGTADLVQDALPLLLGTLPADDDVNIPYRPGFASRYAFRLDMLSERSSFLSGQIRNEKRTAGMPYTVARTRTVREASDRQRAKRLPCRRPLAPRCYTPGCLKSVRWRETNRRGGAHFLPLPLERPRAQDDLRRPPGEEKRVLFFFSTRRLPARFPRAGRATCCACQCPWLPDLCVCACRRATATGRAAFRGGNAEHADARVTLPPPVIYDGTGALAIAPPH